MIAVVARSDVNATGSETKSATTQAVATAIVPWPAIYDVSQYQAFDCALLNSGMRKVVCGYRRCLCTCHRNQHGENRHRDREEEFLHFQAPSFRIFSLTHLKITRESAACLALS